MVELLLLFPPQWSPFQPALSVPSLSAWLRRAGYEVRGLDLNVSFYEWLLSDECAELLIDLNAKSDRSAQEQVGYEAIFRRAADFRHDVSNLTGLGPDPEGLSQGDYLKIHYLAVKSLETYLRAVSDVCQGFVISPYEFQLKAGNLNAAELDRQLASPPPLLAEFVRAAIAEHVRPVAPEVIGLSCIGQDQLFFSLLLGSMLKEAGVSAPILVGGTILARSFERGALPRRWFSTCFDVIVRNEGEKPCERMLANLRAGRPLVEDVPGVVYLEGERIASTVPAPPLSVEELPVPDFDDSPLGQYLSAEITLPLLSSRGCYWGKCEFCHHGMVYGDKYQAYDAELVAATVTALSEKYGARHFAFNDEAIPPRLVRALGRLLPPHESSGWDFTGLIKFERSFTREDFSNLHRIGFRSLYVGLESASERVLALMKKNNKKETLVRNLRDATEVGIWMHCFLFFGFPGETEADAQETYDFVVENADIISSFGSATFALEHNAPIYHHLEDFRLEIRPITKDDVDVYYEYAVGDGISPERATEWMQKVNDAAFDIPQYNAAGWVPRELQLCLLSVMSPERLVELGLRIRESSGLPPEATLPEIVSRCRHDEEGRCLAVSRVLGKVYGFRGNVEQAFHIAHDTAIDVESLRRWGSLLFERFAYSSEVLSSDAVMSPVPAPL